MFATAWVLDGSSSKYLTRHVSNTPKTAEMNPSHCKSLMMTQGVTTRLQLNPLAQAVPQQEGQLLPRLLLARVVVQPVGAAPGTQFNNEIEI